MDRGISSADSVMNYLVLFLLPSLVECAVTLVLFFVHFDSPELTATAFLSFVLYIVLTVQITQWRKKYATPPAQPARALLTPSFSTSQVPRRPE